MKYRITHGKYVFGHDRFRVFALYGIRERWECALYATGNNVDRFFVNNLVDAVSTVQPEFRLIYCLLKF